MFIDCCGIQGQDYKNRGDDQSFKCACKQIRFGESRANAFLISDLYTKLTSPV